MIVHRLWHFFPVPISMCSANPNGEMHSNTNAKHNKKHCLALSQIVKQSDGVSVFVLCCKLMSKNFVWLSIIWEIAFATCRRKSNFIHYLALFDTMQILTSATRLTVGFAICLSRHWNRNRFLLFGYTFISLSWVRAPFDFVSLWCSTDNL